MANSITDNHSDVMLIVLLIDERPEEVTDMKRNVKAEVVSSTFDEPANRHVQVAEMVIEKAKRLTEAREQCDHPLRFYHPFGQAYNTVVPPSGKILSGGLIPMPFTGRKDFSGPLETSKKVVP